MTDVAKSLHNYCNLLLNEDSSWAMRKEALEQMHALFVQAGALDAYGDAGRQDAVNNSSGKAIAPAWAAMCLFDIARTRQFVLGIRQAIQDQLQQGPGPVQLLDAGCGPYALLSLLPALYFTPQQLQLSVLDIHEANIHSAKTLIDALQLNHHFAEIVCADALQYQWPQAQPPHIIVTETMNRALSKEPQVAISLQLAKLLNDKGILIPQQIEVSLVQVDKQLENAARFLQADETTKPADYCKKLAGIICLNKHTTKEEIEKQPLAVVTIPADYDAARHRLELQTELRVYGECWLRSGESGVTMPIVVKGNEVGRKLMFKYEIVPEPFISYQS